MRIRKKPWAAQELAENPHILRDTGTYKDGFAAYFNDKKPIHLEIGCGKGRFITQMATKYPDIHFVGLERDPTILAAAARLAREMPHPPVFVQMEAADLPLYAKPGEIARLYLNFSDPWPNKKKWAKRRLTHVNFLAMYERLLIPEVFFKTDNRLLFEFSINQFSERGWKLRAVSLDLHHSDITENVMTEYEEKFAAKGSPIYRLEAYCEALPPPDSI